MAETVIDLKKEKEDRKELVNYLKKQIEDKKEIEKKIKEIEDLKEKEVLNPQPSTAFINKVYKDHRLMYEKLNSTRLSKLS